MGTAARDRCIVRRPADLCVAQVDHVLSHIVLFLRAAEAQFPGSLYLPASRGARPASAPQRSHVANESREHAADSSPRRSRGTDDRLAGGSVPAVGAFGAGGADEAEAFAQAATA